MYTNPEEYKEKLLKTHEWLRENNAPDYVFEYISTLSQNFLHECRSRDQLKEDFENYQESVQNTAEEMMDIITESQKKRWWNPFHLFGFRV